VGARAARTAIGFHEEKELASTRAGHGEDGATTGGMSRSCFGFELTEKKSE